MNIEAIKTEMETAAAKASDTYFKDVLGGDGQAIRDLVDWLDLQAGPHGASGCLRSHHRR
jgi:hypothetical protein